jgi:hypothetical protein
MTLRPERISLAEVPPNWREDPLYVYVGRAGKGLGGEFGNPIRKGDLCPCCGSVHAEPGETIPCYAVYIQERLRTDACFAESVRLLHDRVLVCFCPIGALCHGNVLAEAAAFLQEQAGL